MAMTRVETGATLIDERRLGPRLLELTVRSAAMDRELAVRVLVPAGWDRRADRTWPLLFLFHGGLDDHRAWTRETDVEALSADSDVIVVMPEGGAAGGYVDWWNFGRPGAPRWETFHVAEVRRLMEERYRAGTARAAAGVSGGGYGALVYSARNPGTFRFAAAFSSPCSIRRPLVSTGLLAATLFGGRINPLPMWGVPLVHDRIWRRYDPIHLAEGLRGIGLYLSAGTGRRGPLDPPAVRRDVANIAEPIVRSTVRPFLDRLARLDIPITTHLYREGTHSWPYWERELRRAWPLIMDSLAGG